MERQLPKNVRQIGNVSDSSKIYVEDYVDTFFNQLCEKAEAEMQGAFLVGETVHEEDQDYIYIYGAIGMQQLEMRGKDLQTLPQERTFYPILCDGVRWDRIRKDFPAFQSCNLKLWCGSILYPCFCG